VSCKFVCRLACKHPSDEYIVPAVNAIKLWRIKCLTFQFFLLFVVKIMIFCSINLLLLFLMLLSPGESMTPVLLFLWFIWGKVYQFSFDEFFSRAFNASQIWWIHGVRTSVFASYKFNFALLLSVYFEKLLCFLGGAKGLVYRSF